jgi:hypothetical protein
VGFGAYSLGAQAQQRKEVGEVDQSFGFPPLGIRQWLPLVLLVQQSISALLHSRRQLELHQIPGHLDFDPSGRRRHVRWPC